MEEILVTRLLGRYRKLSFYPPPLQLTGEGSCGVQGEVVSDQCGEQVGSMLPDGDHVTMGRHLIHPAAQHSHKARRLTSFKRQPVRDLAHVPDVLSTVLLNCCC